MTDLKTQILETVRLHRDTARAAYHSRDREVAILKGEVDMLRQTLAAVRSENFSLRAQVRKLGGVPATDCLVAR